MTLADHPAWQSGGRTEWPVLRGRMRADAVIVGGGLTGVTTALMLTAMGKKTVLLEAERLGTGATAGCTGLSSPGLGLMTKRITRTAGRDSAGVFERLHRECLTDIPGMLARLSIRCGLDQQTDGRFTVLPHLYLEELARRAAQLGCSLFEGSRVRQIAGHRVMTDRGSILADTIVLATGMPLDCRRFPVLALCSQHVFEQRLLKGDPAMAPAAETLPDCLTLRKLPYGIVLRCDLGLAGRPHLRRHTALDEDVRRHFGSFVTADTCFRQEVMTLDGLPLVGAVYPGFGHLLMACGYNGMGLTGSFLAARLLTGVMTGHPLPETALFSPDRGYPGHLLTICRGAGALALRGVAQAGRLFSPRCPHMGCRLVYDRVTRRWECPCHGSSFAADGHVCCGPSAEDAVVRLRDRSN